MSRTEGHVLRFRRAETLDAPEWAARRPFGCATCETGEASVPIKMAASFFRHGGCRLMVVQPVLRWRRLARCAKEGDMSPLLDMLGIRLPIIQAPMAGTSTPAPAAAAVS